MKKKAPALCDWVRRMNNEHAYLQQGDWLANDEIPETLLPVLQRMASEHLPVLQDTDRLLDDWRAANPDATEIERFIGTHKFTVEGVEAERVVLPYCLWMFQRPIDYYQSIKDSNEVNELLNQIGFAEAFQKGLSNRLGRPNNLLQFA